MPVVFDSTFLISAFFENAPVPSGVDRADERLRFLLEVLSKSADTVIVPTPALAELLVYAQADGPKLLAEIQKDKNIRVAEFGIRAAVEVASWTAQAIRSGDKRQGVNSPWQKVKLDRQICAIGKVEGATTVYSDDENLRSHARKIGLDAFGLADLPTPPEPPQRGFWEDPKRGSWS